MPDLSAYISFKVRMDVQDKNNPVWVLADDAGYPVGVPAGITGVFEITQPDGGIYSGDWLTPDVVYSSGSLQPAIIAMRLATGNVIQPGTYTIKYTIDHASYSPTVLTRTFTITYAVPAVTINESFDVFTPQLSVADGTTYSAAGYTIGSLSRAWSAVIGTVGTVTGTGSSQSLIYSGNYYDAAYSITLISEYLAQSTTYSYLEILERITTIHLTDAWTPPTSSDLLTYLKTLKSRLDALINSCQRYDRAKADYEYAFVLYTHLRNRVCAGDTVNVYTYIQEILDILHYHSAVTVTHTNAAITAYNFAALCSTGNTVAAYIHIVDGTETAETSPSDYAHYTEPSLIGKTFLQISLDGIIRKFTQGGTPIQPPNDGEFHFETAVGKFWYAPGLNIDQYIQVLYIQ